MYQLYEFAKMVAEHVHKHPEFGDSYSHTHQGLADYAAQLLKNITIAEDDVQNAAIERYCYRSENNIEVDDNAFVSEGDTGSWVSAWVWVPREDWDEKYEKEMEA